MGGIIGGGKKKAPAPAPAPTPVAPPEPTGVTRAEQLAASRRRSRGGRDGSRSLMSGSRLGPDTGMTDSMNAANERQRSTLG
jgi:hypothetical protein